MKWIKIILLCCVVFMISCHKEEITPVTPPNVKIDVFTQSEINVSNGDEVMFKLTSDSVYVLKLIDKTTNQVISKEKIIGKVGENIINIYTKSIQSKYLYLILETIDKKELKKTTININ